MPIHDHAPSQIAADVLRGHRAAAAERLAALDAGTASRRFGGEATVLHRLITSLDTALDCTARLTAAPALAGAVAGTPTITESAHADLARIEPRGAAPSGGASPAGPPIAAGAEADIRAWWSRGGDPDTAIAAKHAPEAIGAASEALYGSDPTIRAEFPTPESFAGYVAGRLAGRIRILGQT